VKAERLPGWKLRRLNAQQRRAYDLLRYGLPGAADRARAKDVLGWKPTREERLALALELLADGTPRKLVADKMGVGVEYLDRLLRQANADKASQNTGRCRDFSRPSDASKGSGHPGRRPPLEGFASVADLDAWLEAGQP
jgi:hypothetical protein